MDADALRQQAEQGDADAQVELGVMYSSGQGVPEDAPEAVRWFRAAAEQGNAIAQANLGLMYASGRGVTEDVSEAAFWLRLAAEQGDADSQVKLGIIYATGRGPVVSSMATVGLDRGTSLPKDAAEAVRWWRRAAEQGDARAQVNLGFMYAEGQGVPQDDLEAARWYRLAAEQGEAGAQFNLGSMYAEGLGVPQDAAEAVRWYRLAAEQGESTAQFALGVMYARGRGVPEDAAEAASWFRVAAQQGNPRAQRSLALSYASGIGVPMDLVLAYMWLSIASANGENVSERRDDLESLMTREQIARATELARACMTSTDPAWVVYRWQLSQAGPVDPSYRQALDRLLADLDAFDNMDADEKHHLMRRAGDFLNRARSEGRRRGEICPFCCRHVIVSDSLCRKCLLMELRVAGVLLSRWLPPGLWRKCVMFALLGLGLLAPLTTWWLIASWPAAAMFSPRLTGQAAYLAGRFAAGAAEAAEASRR